MKIRCFLFEDDERVRALLLQILESRGYEVLSFSDPELCPMYGASACPCNPEETCGDIIISDVKMPNVTGLGFVDRQKEIGCKINNVALISGAWSDFDLEHAQKLGCKTFQKPFILDELNEWLNECEKGVDPNRILRNWFQEMIPESW